MTEAELLTSTSNAFTNMMTAFAVLLTLCSGYLVAAYAVGRELARSQVVIVNSIFTLASIFFAGVSCGSMVRGVDFGNAVAEVYTTGPTAHVTQEWVWLLMLICLAMYIGCMKFMWDIRSRKHD